MILKAVPFAVCCSFFVGLLCGAAQGGEPSWTERGLVPEYVCLDMEADLYILQNDGALYAHDLVSGVEHWTYAFPEKEAKYRIYVGRTLLMVLFPEKTAVALRKATGEEVWHAPPRDHGTLLSATVIDTSDWFAMYYKKVTGPSETDYVWTAFLHEPEGETSYQVPANHRILGFSHADSTLLLSGPQQTADPPHRARAFFWDFKNDTLTSGFELTWRENLGGASRLATGEFLLFEYRFRQEERVVSSVLDPSTGNVRRILAPPQDTQTAPRLLNGRRAAFLNASQDTLWVLDAETGDTLHTLHKKDHLFLLDSISNDTGGNPWILSRERLGHLWLWPIASDASPRMIFNAEHYLPGSILGMHHGHVLLDPYLQYGETVVFAKRLDDFTTVAAWRVAHHVTHPPTPCAQMVRCLVQVSPQGNVLAEVYEAGKDAPIFTVPCKWAKDLSPDGRHAVIDTEEAVIVFHVDSGTPVIRVAKQFENAYIAATFSRDGRLFAVYPSSMGTVSSWRLEEDYPETTCLHPQEDRDRGVGAYNITFSPDGSRLFAGGRFGRAWLFDVQTGAHVHTFVEPGRIRNPRPQRAYLFGYLVPFYSQATDFAGRFSDRFRTEPQLSGAFAQNGKEVITVAEGLWLRAWDAEMGRFLRVIETGLPEKRDEQGWIHNKVVFSANGDHALTHNSDYGAMTLWDVSTGRELRRYGDAFSGRWSIHLPDDGRFIYLGGWQTLHRLPGRSAE